MSSEVLVTLRGVGKAYPRFDRPYQHLLHMLAPRALGGDEFHALRDVDLEIRRGEAIGIIGRNGSGKSTLLQVIAGILQPTSGQLQVRARISALLELGAGFNPEFTGRENVRLNASVLGLSEADIDSRMDTIIAFAEIGPHLDAAVKTYSSGMFVRLAFSVAVHTDPDVLIVDEALSVGDIYFQRKCFKRIEEMRQQGCTLLFVTHGVDALLQLCDRGVVLDRGRVAFDGESRDAVKEYLRLVFGDNGGAQEPTQDDVDEQHDAQSDERDELAVFLAGGPSDDFSTRPGYNRDETRLGDGRATTCDFLISGPHGYGPLVQAREPFRISARYHFVDGLDRLIFGVRVLTVTGIVVYSANTLVTEGRLFSCDAGTTLAVDFNLRCALLPGQYFVTVGVSRHLEDGVEVAAIDRRSDALILSVVGERRHAEGVADMELSCGTRALGGRIHPG